MQKRAAGIFWNDWTRWNRCAPGQRHSHMQPKQRDCGETTQPQRQTVAPRIPCTQVSSQHHAAAEAEARQCLVSPSAVSLNCGDVVVRSSWRVQTQVNSKERRLADGHVGNGWVGNAPECKSLRVHKFRT